MYNKHYEKKLYDNYISYQYNITNQQDEAKYELDYKFAKNTYWDIFAWLDKNIKIIDLWCWFWRFAYFCQKEGFKNYIWIDIWEENINLCKKRFKEYIFLKNDIIEYLKSLKNNSVDIFHISHVFEHFTLEEWLEISKLINKKLKKWWIWLNIMPNADAYFGSATSMYTDITHKRIYNYLSFNEILLLSWFDITKIEHRNYWHVSKIKKIIHKFFLKIFEACIIILWYWKSKYYTTSLVTIIKK
jgi:hypothetical protein